MRRRNFVGSIFLISLTFAVSAFSQVPVRKNWRDAAPQTVTLFSRAKYKDPNGGYERSAFSFRYGLRSDIGYDKTRNNYELLYGSFNINGDSDWFGVTMVTDDCSRIKDLGELQWSDLTEVPVLAAGKLPAQGIRVPSPTETFEESSQGQVTRVSLGHIYVVHSKDRETDFYTLFRVETLIPSDQVTISWKVVPPPKAPAYQ